MRSTDTIEKYVKNTTVKTDPQVNKAVLDDLLDRMDRASGAPCTVLPHGLRRTIMISQFTKFAAAALVFAAVLLGLNFIPGSDSGQVFANVMNRVMEAHSVRYKWTTRTEKYEFSYVDMINNLGIKRCESAEDDYLLFNFSTGTYLRINTTSKSADLMYSIGRKKTSSVFAWLDWVSKLHRQDSEYIGKEMYLDRVYDIYMIKNPYDETKVWVDPKTDLPFRIVMEKYPNPESTIKMPEMYLSTFDFGATGNTSRSIGGTITSGRGSPYGIQERETVTYSNFEWNIELDDSLFSFAIPDDYEVKERHHNVEEKMEGGLVEALSFWTEMNGGAFPDDINNLADPDKAKPLLIMKYDKNGDPEEEMTEAWKTMGVLMRAMYFAQERKAEGTWHYAGQGMTLGTPDTPLCWWKEGNFEKYTVIFADLSIDTMADEELLQ